MLSETTLFTEWVVYELLSGGGTGDSVTRLSLHLEDSLPLPDPASVLSNFTLCLWFRVTTFLEMSTLLSYALSETLDDVLQFRKSTPISSVSKSKNS